MRGKASERDFLHDLAMSKGICQDNDLETLRSIFTSSEIRKGTRSEDRSGADYVVKLGSGRTINIDAKFRDTAIPKSGFRVSSNWQPTPDFPYGQPDLTLEEWSCEPTPLMPKGRVGWTLDYSKTTDYVLWTWHPLDTRDYILMPFQLLRMAFWVNRKHWKIHFKANRSKTGGPNGMKWTSVCYFVPANVVLRAIWDQMFGPCWSNERMEQFIHYQD